MKDLPFIVRESVFSHAQKTVSNDNKRRIHDISFSFFSWKNKNKQNALLFDELEMFSVELIILVEC